MGNYRFKFSDIIPNAWFYKLRDLTKKKLDHHRKAALSDQTVVNPPALTFSSSSIKDKQLHHHHRPSSSSSFSVSSQSQYQRKSYHFTRDVNKTASPPYDGTPPENFYEEEADGVVQLPRRSSKKRRGTRRNRASPRLVSSFVRSGYSCRSSAESVRTTNSPEPEFISKKYPNSAADTFSETESQVQTKCIDAGGGGVTATETTESTSYSWSSRLEDDIVIDIKSKLPATHFYKHDDDKFNTVFNSVSKIELSPIKTKSNNINKSIQPIKTKKQTPKSEESKKKKIIKDNEKSNPQLKRNSLTSHSPGLKLRTNTPKIVNQKIRSRKSVSTTWRKSLSESLAVVTSSKDPERDFRESMVEMIVEHNIWSATELEDLLACYLSLNSYNHHHLIINVFNQIWFHFLHA